MLDNLAQNHRANLDTVSTTRGSGWVRSSAFARSLKATHPPATAGGTDCVQQRVLSREATLDTLDRIKDRV